jgi:aspartyl-tRNA(Asn)/glutamyl-tRNA(Gln) amidotransferase subunit B
MIILCAMCYPGTSAKTLLRHILDNPTTISIPFQTLIDLLSLRAVSSSNSDSLRALCQAAIDALPREVEAARKGNDRVIMRLVGHVMKASRGTVDARAVGKSLRDMLLAIQTNQDA